jgi:hypothetical protein
MGNENDNFADGDATDKGGEQAFDFWSDEGARSIIIFRARQLKPKQHLKSSRDFGPPPIECATRSNRMSPAGIVMFYGSKERATAIAEIDDDPSLGIVVGKFKTIRELRILDLTRLPRPLRFFEPQPETSIENRYVISFLNSFGKSMAAKVEPGDREHIDYVPTQVVTEWFRTMPLAGQSPIDGICYPSSQCVGGTSSYYSLIKLRLPSLLKR